MAGGGCAPRTGAISASVVTTPTQGGLDAASLSGGRITRFIPQPGLPDSRNDRDLLQACRQIQTGSSAARSAIVVFKSSYGNIAVSALQSGTKTLIVVGGVERGLRAGELVTGKLGVMELYPRSRSTIILTAGSRSALVGEQRVRLSDPVAGVENGTDLVMTLADLIRVFRARATQRDSVSEIRDPRIIYSERQYHP